MICHGLASACRESRPPVEVLPRIGASAGAVQSRSAESGDKGSPSIVSGVLVRFEFSGAPKAFGESLSTAVGASSWSASPGMDCQRLLHRCVHDGQGSAFGTKPSPCIKIATNSEMNFRMEEDMYFDAVLILDGDASVAGVGSQVYSELLKAGSGKY